MFSTQESSSLCTCFVDHYNTEEFQYVSVNIDTLDNSIVIMSGSYGVTYPLPTTNDDLHIIVHALCHTHYYTCTVFTYKIIVYM